MTPGQIHHIEYYVNNLETTKEFWSWLLERLDYKLFQEFGDGVSYEHTSGTYIVFVKVSAEFTSHKNNRQASGLNHIAFQGTSKKELKKLTGELKEKGIKILKKSEDYLCFEEGNEFAVEVYAK